MTLAAVLNIREFWTLDCGMEIIVQDQIKAALLTLVMKAILSSYHTLSLLKSSV